MNEQPKPPVGARQLLVEALDSSIQSTRMHASAVVLALGAGRGDDRALEILAEAGEDSSDLPRCLSRRTDLIDTLLKTDGVARQWGFLLATEHPGVAHLEVLDLAIRRCQHGIMSMAAARAAKAADDIGLVAAVVQLFLNLEPENRSDAAAFLRRHPEETARHSAAIESISEPDSIVLDSLIGRRPAAIAVRVGDLDPTDRGTVVPQLSWRPEILQRLPWQRWLAEDAGVTTSLLADISWLSDCDEMASTLQDALARHPDPRLMRAIADIGSPECSGLLIEQLSQPSLLHRAIAMDCLGELGGPKARQALRCLAESSTSIEVAPALRSLARCALDEDLPAFRARAGDADPEIRRICAQVLSCRPDADNLPVLMELVTDPEWPVAAAAVEAFLGKDAQ